MTTSTTCAICRRPDPAGANACPACQGDLHALLAELPHQMVLLRASLHPGAPTHTGTTGGRATAPLPVRLDVLSLLGPAAAAGTVRGPAADQTGPVPITAVLQDWVSLAATVRGQRPPVRPTAEACAAYLAARLGWACTQPWIAELAADLRAVIRTVRGITRTEPRTRPLDTPCICGAFGLTATDWAEYVTCGVCRRQMTRQEYAGHAAQVLPPLYRVGVLITAANATEVDMATDRATVWKAPDGTHWRAYGPANYTDTGTDLYEVAQNPDTRQWHRVSGGLSRGLPTTDFEATYTPVPAEPLRDPRITRLTELVTELLADYSRAAGHTHHATDAIRAALADVADIPQEARQQRHRATAQAQRTGFRRSTG